MDINDNINNDNKKSDLPWLQSANIIHMNLFSVNNID